MSILIKGMKMPSSCIKGGCPLDGAACDLWEDKNWEDFHDPHIMRHPDCPLIELPPHVRLIDADAICAECCDSAEEYDGIYPDCSYCIVHGAPTVIEAKEVSE